MVWCPPREVDAMLKASHYLGPTKRGWAWVDDFGCLVVAPPTSRRLPARWLDLTRWCITSRVESAGSRQWRWVKKALLEKFPEVTTIVSYSDPGVGHDGALYRACNWWWAPTWLRLRPPPTGNGCWGVKGQIKTPKDRWVFALRDDPARVPLLVAKDESILRRWPWARYTEPGGVPYKQRVIVAGETHVVRWDVAMIL
jgi:hypothetical protein